MFWRILEGAGSFALVLAIAATAAAQSAERPAAPLLLPAALDTQTPAVAGTAREPSIYDKIWRFTEFYRSETNPIVQRVLFTGRFQYEFAALDADQGDHDEWNVRRLRFGPRVTLFHDLTVHVELDVNPQEHDPFYVRLTDAYVMWTRNASLSVTVGKQSLPFTMEGATSSRELITIDRSNLANNMWFPEEYSPGVSVSGRMAPWNYRLGVYSAGARNREFGEFTGGIFTLAVLGYDFGKRLGVKEALLTGNYVYQQPDENNTFTRQLEQVASINFRFEADRWGFRTDLTAGQGYLGQSDLWGYVAMPFFNITNSLQIVGRYTFVGSQDNNGVRLATYESRVVDGRGNDYEEGYFGANYYFYSHRLKLQTGLQFATMEDRANDGGAYSGLSWVTGLRVSW